MMANQWMLIVKCRYIYVKKINTMDIEHSIKELSQMDSDLISLLNSFKIDNLLPEKNYFKSLSRSIIYQQLTAKSAKAIHDRFISIYETEEYPSPEEVLSTTLDDLKSVGLSKFKAQYLHNLSNSFLKEPFNYQTLNQESDKDIIDILTQIKGVGLWTAQMFLMFTLNRPDVFPATDLALQKGFQQYFNISQLPKANEMLEISQKWRPHRTTVSLFLWRLIEGPFEW